MEFATPPVKQYHEQDEKNDDFCFERASVPSTELYGEVPEKLYREGNKVSDLRYLDNSTKGEVNTKTPETFEDICDGTYNDYLCILFNTLYFLFVGCIFYLTYVDYCVFLKAMAEMFPDLGKPLPHTPHTVSPTTTTWTKVDRDIAQHTYTLHGDMISKLQEDVKELSTKVQELKNDLLTMKNLQRTHPTSTSNHTVVTANKNAVVRYYASPPTQGISSNRRWLPPTQSKIVNPYLKKRHSTNQVPRTGHVVNPYLKKRHSNNFATWPRK